jgi:hypothetical protein
MGVLDYVLAEDFFAEGDNYEGLRGSTSQPVRVITYKNKPNVSKIGGCKG